MTQVLLPKAGILYEPSSMRPSSVLAWLEHVETYGSIYFSPQECSALMLSCEAVRRHAKILAQYDYLKPNQARLTALAKPQAAMETAAKRLTEQLWIIGSLNQDKHLGTKHVEADTKKEIVQHQAGLASACNGLLTALPDGRVTINGKPAEFSLFLGKVLYALLSRLNNPTSYLDIFSTLYPQRAVKTLNKRAIASIRQYVSIVRKSLESHRVACKLEPIRSHGWIFREE